MPKEQQQVDLFENTEWWREHWQGMPEFVQEDQAPLKSVIVHFRSREEMLQFADLVGQRLTMDTKSIWYPKSERKNLLEFRYDES